MISIMMELQAESLNSSVPVSALLRKALVVVKKLKISQFEVWVKNELDGYHEVNRQKFKIYPPYSVRFISQNPQ